VRVYFAGPLFTPYERSFIDECAARLRADGIEVFVPHENALAAGDTSPATIFHKDWDGLVGADAVVAVLDGSMVDDGTACEIGIFYALMQGDPTKKGIVPLITCCRGILDVPLTAKRFRPTGGVTTPISMFSVSMIPSATGSIFMA